MTELHLSVHSVRDPRTDDRGVTRIDLRKIEIRDEDGRVLAVKGLIWGRVGPWLAGQFDVVSCDAGPVDDDVVVQRMRLSAGQEYLVLVIATELPPLEPVP